MKILIVLFISILFLGVVAPVKTHSGVVHCPFPEYGFVWKVDKYICEPSASFRPPPPIEKKAASPPVVVRQPQIIVQTVPQYYVYPYPVWRERYWWGWSIWHGYGFWPYTYSYLGWESYYW